MYYKKHQNTILVRLERGEKLIENLNRLAAKEAMGTVWLQGLGGAKSAELGFYDLETKQYNWQSFAELMEITSLQGNLAWVDDQPKWHIHATLGGRDYRAVGGHVKELVVGGTCELRLDIVADTALHRRRDVATGLDLLDVS
jgi:predicted DNA-binding protein with PD1-like motif